MLNLGDLKRFKSFFKGNNSLITDTTHVSFSDSDKPFFSPACSPFILEHPVAISLGYNCHQMINIDSISTPIKYSGSVIHHFRCIYHNWKRVLYQFLWQIFTTLNYIIPIDFEFPLFNFASFLSRYIWIFFTWTYSFN